jgi:hypothetical protein
MDAITFCVPYYGKEPAHTELLSTSIRQINKYYPNNRILICKTSDSYVPDLSGYRVEIHNTFVDGSHIIGAIELLVRKCETKNFIICHDSMFLLKPLPTNILHRPFYSLWHFNEKSRYMYTAKIEPYVKALNIPPNDINKIHHAFRSSIDKEWNGVFGPAFGGTIDTLKIAWEILNINNESIKPYIGREGLMASERIIAIIFMYMGFNMEQSVNGNVYTHPNLFNDTPIPDFNTVNYEASYFYKIWKKR